jgi:NAD(P)-dependent dehydrogenase (short-subunit alcohol dehydrogenase family)
MFKTRSCLITGAAGNLGRAVARKFASEGATLVLLGRSVEQLRAAFPSADTRSLLVAADLLDSASVEAAVESAAKHCGRIDILCNLAGGFRMGPPVHETPDATWDLMLGLNARSVVNTARAVVPLMLAAGYGRIINVAATAGLAGKENVAAYSAAKAAVMRLTESMSAELRDRGINVNCVLPSIIDTTENRAAMPAADPRRWVAPAALADVIAFLASDAAREIHGASIPVSGLV